MFKKIKRIRYLIFLGVITALIAIPVPDLSSLAAEDDELTVTEIAVVPVSNVIYKELTDTYVMGPSSSLELKFTTLEKITGQNDTPRFTWVGSEYVGGPYEAKHAVVVKYDRTEGDHTAVFKVFCGENAQSARININRRIGFSAGNLTCEETIPAEGGGTTIVEKTAWAFNLEQVSSLSKFIYRNEWPTIRLSPEPDDIAGGRISNGLSADSLIVDLNDEVLDPSDFQIRYELWDLTRTNVKVESDWFTAQDRNLIAVPADYRNKEVSLLLEIKDALGNYRPYSYNYMAKLSGGYCRMRYMQSNVLAGGSMNEFFNTSLQWTAEERSGYFAEAKAMFTNDVRAQYSSQYERNYTDIAVFIYSPQLSGLVDYAKTRDDIDIDNCGFQWSTDRDHYDPSRPVQKFNQEEGDANIISSAELVPGYGYSEGYWCIINADYDGIMTDGVYYLHLRIADAVSGGVTWEPLYYIYKNPDNTTGGEPAKLMRDDTPPAITFSEDAGNPNIVTVTLADDYCGVGYSQLGISTTSGYTEDPDVWNGVNGACNWYDIVPELDGGAGLFLTKTEDTGGHRRVSFTVDKTQLPGMDGASDFYLHVRSRDQSYDGVFGDNWVNKIGYTSQSIHLNSGGIVSPGVSPACPIAYSSDGPVNQPVTATISPAPGCRVINNGGSNTYTFYQNGSFTFMVRDENGSDFEYPATVTHIDLSPPVITLDGLRTYAIYQGLAFDFADPGFSAADAEAGDLTAQVQVTNNINIYKGGYYEVIYTVTDNAGNTAREVRGVSVYETNGINLFINNIRVKGGETINAGTLNFKLVGLASESYRLLYLPGKQKLGAFKEGGTLVIGNTADLAAGWYTFFVQDAERKTFVAHVLLQ